MKYHLELHHPPEHNIRHSFPLEPGTEYSIFTKQTDRKADRQTGRPQL